MGNDKNSRRAWLVVASLVMMGVVGLLGVQVEIDTAHRKLLDLADDEESSMDDDIEFHNARRLNLKFDDTCGSNAKCDILKIDAKESKGKIKIKTKAKCKNDEITDDAYAELQIHANVGIGGNIKILDDEMDFCDKYSATVKAFGFTLGKLKIKGAKCPIKAGKTIKTTTTNQFGDSDTGLSGTATSEFRAFFEKGGDLMYCFSAEMET